MHHHKIQCRLSMTSLLTGLKLMKEEPRAEPSTLVLARQGYRGFQQKFAPMVVRRALLLDGDQPFHRKVASFPCSPHPECPSFLLPGVCPCICNGLLPCAQEAQGIGISIHWSISIAATCKNSQQIFME